MNKLRQVWENSKSSLWLVPTLMVTGAIVLAVAGTVLVGTRGGRTAS